MEQIVILILFVIGSIVSSIIQNRKKREAESLEDLHRGPPSGPPPAQQPPFQRWPRSSREWQDELRKLLQQEELPSVVRPVPPPLPPPAKFRPPLLPAASAKAEKAEGDAKFPSPFKKSNASFERATGLHDRVRNFMQAVDRRTVAHKPPVAAKAAPPAQHLRWLQTRQGVRQAFIASIVFSPPVALTTDH